MSSDGWLTYHEPVTRGRQAELGLRAMLVCAVGHSVGEIGAVAATGRLSVSSAVRLAVRHCHKR